MQMNGAAAARQSHLELNQGRGVVPSAWVSSRLGDSSPVGFASVSVMERAQVKLSPSHRGDPSPPPLKLRRGAPHPT